jgi:hypothetical protein
LKTICSHLHFLRISIIFFGIILTLVLINLLTRWDYMPFGWWSSLN